MINDLIKAARDGDLASVNAIIKCGASLDASDSFGYNALHWAARYGHADVVNALVNNGASLNDKSNFSNTSLHSAAIYGHADVAKILIDKGADINLVGESGLTALGLATREGHPAIAIMLESASQRLSANGSGRRSAIMTLLDENDSLRSRLGIKPGLEFKSDFNIDKLIDSVVKKREASDPKLRDDIETEIAYHVEATRILCDDSNERFGKQMRL